MATSWSFSEVQRLGGQALLQFHIRFPGQEVDDRPFHGDGAAEDPLYLALLVQIQQVAPDGPPIH